MTNPEKVCVDPVSEIVDIVTRTLKDVFTPDASCPPVDGGGGTDVRFFAGDGAPLAAWDAHASGDGCDNPFLWVRVMRRFRSETFPAPSVSDNPCGLPRVVAIEIGVGRCAVVDADPSWDDYAREAEISLDDSWRIELAMCGAARRCAAQSYQVGTDTVAPFGPEGGVVAWTGVIYVGF